MRKVKVTLQPDTGARKVYLFPSAAALSIWLQAMEAGEHVQVPNIEELVLEPEGFIEAELMGFEYSYEGPGPGRRLDLVRLGLAQQPKNASGLLISTHVGWVSGGLLPMREHSGSDLRVEALDHAKPGRLDLGLLFKDNESA
jgi:hypothetical protein